MSKKKTIEDCHNLAQEKGGKCLSTEYVNNFTKMLWECDSGHQWHAPRSYIQQGCWCIECAGTKRKTTEECHESAKKKNGKFLSKEYINAHVKYLWECEKGHQWLAKYNYIQRGHWCFKCRKRGGKKPNTIEDCIMAAKENGGELLSKEYVNNHTKLKWRCSKDHVFDAIFGSVKRGHWCPECAKEKRKQTNLKKYGAECALQSQEVALKNARSQNNTFVLRHWRTGEDLVCQASYEKKVVEYLNKNQIDFQWQPEVFTMPDGKTYRPDCFLVVENKWIEIKGYMREKNMKKWLWFHKEYPNSELWNKEKLKHLNIL